MASTPPSVQWMEYVNETGNFARPEPYKWDAGIVEAGSTSKDAEFYVWNNYKGVTPVADMINVRISVRDKNGETTDRAICGQEQAIVAVKMENKNLNQWGSYDSSSSPAWTLDKWEDLDAENPKPVIQCSGKTAPTQTGGTVSGATNTGAITDTDNFIHLKLHLTAKSNADAGTINWITRISYQYT